MTFAQRRITTLPGADYSTLKRIEPSPHRFATGILLLYLFLLMSRGVELLSVLFGANLHITLILMFISLLAAILTRGLLDAAKSPVVLMFTGLTFWFVMTTFTSQWRGGSFRVLTNTWLPSYMCVLLIPSLISTLDQCRKVYYILAFSLVPMLWATIKFAAQIQGRDGAIFGTLGNPNDLAFSLLLLIPFAVFVSRSEFILSWKSIVCILAILYAILKVLKTGSRGALVTMALCGAIMFISGKMKTRVAVLGMAGLVGVVAVVAVSSDVLARYTTIFSGTSAASGMSADEYSAVESTRARKMLFWESVRLTMEHPLFGVGPGIFSAALAGEQKQSGQLQTWHEAHNSFTQLGSEAGLPALGIYLAALYYCLKRTIRIYRRTRNDPSQLAICRMAATLAMALWIFVICGAFGNYSYSFYFPVLAGLAQAFEVCVRQETKTQVVMGSARRQARLPNPPLAPMPAFARNSQPRTRVWSRHDRSSAG